MNPVPPPRVPRSSRSVVGVLAAVAVLTLAVLAAVAAVQVHAGRRRTALGDVDVVARWLRDRSWDDVAVVTIGGVLTGLGLLVLLAAVLPGRRVMLVVRETQEGVTSGITRRGLRTDLAAMAEGVDGVASARARVGRRRVRVRARSGLRDRRGIEAAVVTAVGEELERLGLHRSRRVRATVTGPRDDGPRQPEAAADEPAADESAADEPAAEDGSRSP